MMYKEESLQKYLDDLAAKMPAPGGGSAAAMVASLGAALVSMVVNFTLGKPKYSAYEVELKVILEKSEKLRKEFLELADKDVIAYQSKNMQDALEIPLKVCVLCLEAIELCPPLIGKGNVNLVSDAGVAAVFLEAAFASARFNVEINLKAMADHNLAAGIRKELDEKEKRVKEVRKETEAGVGKIIRG